MFGTNSVNILLFEHLSCIYSMNNNSFILFIMLIDCKVRVQLLNLVHVGKRVARCLAVLCALESRKYHPIQRSASCCCGLSCVVPSPNIAPSPSPGLLP